MKQKFPETCSKSDQTKNNETNNTPPLSNRFQNLVKPEIDFSIDRNLTEKINDVKYTQQSNHRKNIQSVNSKDKRPNICVTEKYLKNNKEIIPNKKVVPGNRSYAETASYGKKILLLETAM